MMGNKPCVADVYAYVVLRWSEKLGIDIKENKKAMKFISDGGD